MDLITVASIDDYSKSIRDLFPQGEFWEKQFSNHESHLSHWCKAKAQELHRFKVRRAALAEEGFKTRTFELIENWERIHGIKSPSGTIEDRRAALVAKTGGSINRPTLDALAVQFGATIVSVSFPLKPRLFGKARFKTRFSGPWVFNFIQIEFDMPDRTNQAKLESAIEEVLLANLLISFVYRSA